MAKFTTTIKMWADVTIEADSIEEAEQKFRTALALNDSIPVAEFDLAEDIEVDNEVYAYTLDPEDGVDIEPLQWDRTQYTVMNDYANYWSSKER